MEYIYEGLTFEREDREMERNMRDDQRYRSEFRKEGSTEMVRRPRRDADILEEVCQRLTDHPDIDASEMEVQVSKCEVTLSGTLPDRQMKRAAEDLAASVRGVHDVHNQVRVPRS